MKTNILFIAILLVVTNAAMAQSSFGVRVGTAFSRLAPDGPYFYPAIGDTEEKFLIGIDAAVFFTIPLSEQLFLQPEVHYLQKGEAYKGDIPLQSGTPFFTARTKRIFNFIEIPVLLKGNVISGKTNLYLLGGPSIGYALSSKLQGDVIGTFYNDTEIALSREGKIDWDQENEFFNAESVRYDISGTLGAALEYHIGKQSLIIDLRYLHDFNDWRNYNGNYMPDKVSSRSFIISLGIGF